MPAPRWPTRCSIAAAGSALLIAEGGIPRRIKVAYLSDADITALADYAAWTRRPATPPAAVPIPAHVA